MLTSFSVTYTGVRNPAQVAAAGMPPQAVPPQALAAAQAAAAQPAVLIQGQEPLTASMLASAPPQEQKQMLGERLFPLIQGMYPELAGKITGEFQIYWSHAFLFFSVQIVNFFCNYRQSCSFVLSKLKLYSESKNGLAYFYATKKLIRNIKGKDVSCVIN